MDSARGERMQPSGQKSAHLQGGALQVIPRQPQVNPQKPQWVINGFLQTLRTEGQQQMEGGSSPTVLLLPLHPHVCSVRCRARCAQLYSLSSVAGRAETSLPRCLFVSVFECFRGKPVPERGESQGTFPPCPGRNQADQRPSASRKLLSA